MHALVGKNSLRMSTEGARSGELCRVLEEDLDLADAIAPALRERAARECIARAARVPEGPWNPACVMSPSEGAGLLILRGLVVRRAGVDDRFGAELLGQGDLLRSYEPEPTAPALRVTTTWRVVEPLRLAVLDEAFVARRLVRYPALVGSLLGRALERSRNLAVNMAIVHHPRVDVRLRMLLWHLASRWGRVRGDGLLLSLQLTHSELADLTAARRPTVTTAMSELVERGELRVCEGGWLLLGAPPGECLEFARERPAQPRPAPRIQRRRVRERGADTAAPIPPRAVRSMP